MINALVPQVASGLTTHLIRGLPASFFDCPKPDEPELDGLRREGATPTQTVGAYLNL